MDEPSFGTDEVTEDELVEAIGEVRETLAELQEHPEEMLAVGVVVAYTDETMRTCDMDGHDHPSSGVSMRMVNPAGHKGYRNIGSLMADLDKFDQQCENLKIDESSDPEPQVMGIDLSDMLGGSGPL